MFDEEEKSSARPAIILLIVVFLVAGYGVNFGLQTLRGSKRIIGPPIIPGFLDVPQPLAQSQIPLPLAPFHIRRRRKSRPGLSS